MNKQERELLGVFAAGFIAAALLWTIILFR